MARVRATRKANDGSVRHLTRTGDGWRFQMRVPAALAGDDFRLAGLAPIVRASLGPRGRGEARRLSRRLATLCETVFAPAAATKDANMDPLSPEENNLAQQVIAACQTAIGRTLKQPKQAVGLARGLNGALTSLLLVQAEVAKGDAGARAVVEHADALTRGALVDVLKLSTQPGDALAALAAVASVAPRTPATGATAPQPAPAAGQAPLFSQLEDEYVAMRKDAGADRATLSTTRLRAGVFRELLGNKPATAYFAKDLQDFGSLLQYLPVAYTRQGEEHEALQHMTPQWLIARNKEFKCWEPLALKTLQDGYFQVVRTIFATGALTHRFHNPFAGLRIRWPKNAKPSVKREALDYEKLDKVFDLGVRSGYLDDAMIPPVAFTSTRRIGIVPWIRGCDISQKHGVDIVRVNGIVYDKARKQYRHVPYKTDASLRFFVLHRFFRDIGFTEWAMVQGEDFIFRQLQQCADPSDTASKRINNLLRDAGAIGMNIEVGHSLRHGGKDLLIDEDIDSEATRLQMGHDSGDVHAGYPSRLSARSVQGASRGDSPLRLHDLQRCAGGLTVLLDEVRREHGLSLQTDRHLRSFACLPLPPGCANMTPRVAPGRPPRG